MWWHRAAIIAACGLLLQCTSSVNTSSQQSYREALRRRLSKAAWCPPPQPSPCVVVPYPYLQPNCQSPRVHSGTNSIITQNTAAGWPEYRIKLPLYMGRPIKTNIIIELPLCMFPQSEQTGVTNNAVSSSSSSCSSNPTTCSASCSSSSSPIADEQGSSQSVEGDKTSESPPEHLSQPENLAECNPNEITQNYPSVPKEDNTSNKGFSTEKSEAPCDNDSPSPSTNYIENKPTVSEPGNDVNPGETDDCIGVNPNEPVDTAPDSLSTNSHSDSIENIPESIPEFAYQDDCELTTDNDNEHAVANNEKSCDHTVNPNAAEKEKQDDGAFEPQPQTEEGCDSEHYLVDDTETTGCTEDDTKNDDLLEPSRLPEHETIAPEDACNTPRTDDGTEIDSSSGSEATSTD